MKVARFNDQKQAEKFNLSTQDVGTVFANETRDGVAFLTIQFSSVEVNGLPADLFVFEENQPQPDTADTQA